MRSPLHHQEGGRSLEDPPVELGQEQTGEEPVIGELTLEVGELGMLVASECAEAIRDRPAECWWIRIAVLGHHCRASATSACRSGAPARLRNSSSSSTPWPRG